MNTLENSPGQICQAANNELIDRQGRDGSKSPEEKDVIERLDGKVSLGSENYQTGRLPVIRNRPYTTENIVVKLPRESSDQC